MRLVFPVFDPPTIMILNVGTIWGTRLLFLEGLTAETTFRTGRENELEVMDAYMEAMDGRGSFSAVDVLVCSLSLLEGKQSLRNGRW